MNDLFGKNIQKMRESREILQKDLAEEINLDRATVSSWERGKSYPTVETLIKISDYFNVSIDSLLGLTNNKKALDDLTEEEKELLKDVRELDRDEKNKLKGYLKALLENK